MKYVHKHYSVKLPTCALEGPKNNIEYKTLHSYISLLVPDYSCTSWQVPYK